MNLLQAAMVEKMNSSDDVFWASSSLLFSRSISALGSVPKLRRLFSKAKYSSSVLNGIVHSVYCLIMNSKNGFLMTSSVSV